MASIKKKVELDRAQAASAHCADMRKMINNIDYSDVVFLCNDNARIHACRLFLVARSIVLHRMLLKGMVESQLSEITLQEISSTALLPVMEFLYTGALQEHVPTDWKNAYDIIGAARFFLLEGLELHAMDYLLLAIAEVKENLEAAAKFLCVAVEFVGIFGETVDLIASDLVSILESASLKPEHLHALTSKAFLYFLEKTSTKDKDEDKNDRDPKLLSSAESQRLRNIILWCACQTFADEEPLTPHAILPEITSMVELLETFPYKPYQPSEIYKGNRMSLALSVKPFLSLVNLQKIHPKLLANVLEPMDIVPHSIIKDAFRFYALHTCDVYDVDSRRWSTNCKNFQIYRTSKDGSVIEQKAPGIGYVRYDFALHHTGWDPVVYVWEMIIEEVCDGFIEIRVHHRLDDDFDMEDGRNLSEQPGGWALRMDTQGIFINRKGKHKVHRGDPHFTPYEKDCSRLVYGKDYGQKNSKIKIYFDSGDKTCRFSIDNDNFGYSVWGDIPFGILFPAVSLGKGPSGRVQIKILHGH